MKKLIAVALAWIAGLLVLTIGASAALAGGWAVTTLDSVPAPSVGVPVEVGFTIRQHGVTPVQPEGDVGIEIRSQAGVTRYFPGRPSGPSGHYVATVDFPEAGVFTWVARQGWFAPQPLGTVVIGPTSAATAAGSATGNGTSVSEEYRWPAVLRIGLVVIGGALVAFSVFDAVRGTRRRRVSAAAP